MADGDDLDQMTAPPDLPPAQQTPAMTAAQFPMPTDQGPQMAIQPSPPSTAMIPPDTAAVTHHMGWLGRALDEVASALAGPDSYQVTRNQDGTVTAQPMPSSSGEKWGKIAAAALGGAGQGLGQSTGINAPARAAAAGVQFGMQLPAAQQQQAEQAADFQNKQMIQRANNALLDQRIIAERFQNQQQPELWNQERAKYAVDMAKSMEDLQADFVGHVSNPADLATYASQSALDAHTGKDGMLMPIPVANGVDVYRVPRDTMNERIDQDETINGLRLDPNDASKTVPFQQVAQAGSMTRGQLLTARKAQIVEDNKTLSQAATNRKNLGGGQPTNENEMILAKYRGLYPNDPQRALTEATQEINRNRLNAAAARNAPFTPPAPGSSADAAMQRKAKDIYTGRLLLTDISPYGRPGQPNRSDYEDAANRYAESLGDTEFNAQSPENEKRYAGMPAVQSAYMAMNRMANPGGLLDQLETQARRAGIGDSAPINTVIQTLRQRMGEGEANALKNDLAEVQQNLAAVLGTPGLTGGLTNVKLQHWHDAYGSNLTLGALAAMNREVRTSINSERQIGFTGNRYLRSQFGAGQTQAPAQSQQQPTAQPQAQRQNFDAGRWAMANPGRDVRAAIAEAQRRGMNVVNAPQ